MFRNKDSSGFEHVFVGESRAKEVIGFHNWIQFYLQEKIGNVDYQGYIRGRGVRGVWYNCFGVWVRVPLRMAGIVESSDHLTIVDGGNSMSWEIKCGWK